MPARQLQHAHAHSSDPRESSSQTGGLHTQQRLRKQLSGRGIRVGAQPLQQLRAAHAADGFAVASLAVADVALQQRRQPAAGAAAGPLLKDLQVLGQID